jgi:hypothetical protein
MTPVAVSLDPVEPSAWPDAEPIFGGSGEVDEMGLGSEAVVSGEGEIGSFGEAVGAG